MRCGGIEDLLLSWILSINVTPDASRSVGLIDSVKTSYSKLTYERTLFIVSCYIYLYFSSRCNLDIYS